MDLHDYASTPYHHIHDLVVFGMVGVSFLSGWIASAMLWKPDDSFRQGMIDTVTFRPLWDRQYNKTVMKRARVLRKLRHRKDSRQTN